MRVLITGGMGVIGSLTTEKFLQEGYRPVVFARHRDDRLIRLIVDHVDIELGDVTDLPRLLEVIKKHRITHIIHAAAFVGAVSAANPALSVQVNVLGTVNVLEAARLFDIQRVVYTSAKGVYGHIDGQYGHPDYEPLPEEHAKNPVRIYDSAKLMGEHAGLHYQANHGVDFVALRFATTYGPGKTARHGKMGITSDLIESAFAGRPFLLAKGRDQKDDFIYNKDVALGIYLACVTKRLSRRVFNIGSGVGVTLTDMANALKEHLPQAVIEIGPGLNYLDAPTQYYSVYDISRARQDLGFSPQFDLAKGIGDYLAILERLQASGE